jgi:hypothetical protein
VEGAGWVRRKDTITPGRGRQPDRNYGTFNSPVLFDAIVLLHSYLSESEYLRATCVICPYCLEQSASVAWFSSRRDQSAYKAKLTRSSQSLLPYEDDQERKRSQQRPNRRVPTGCLGLRARPSLDDPARTSDTHSIGVANTHHPSRFLSRIGSTSLSARQSPNFVDRSGKRWPLFLGR